MNSRFGHTRLLLWALLSVGLVTAGCVAIDRMYANVRVPKAGDNEYPPRPEFVRASADEAIVLGGLGAGLSCSLPLRPVFDFAIFPRNPWQTSPVSLRMRQACAMHDFCYRHGAATYGYTQADCDLQLQENAARLCRQVNRGDSVPKCLSEARRLLVGVRIGGVGSFRPALTDAANGAFRSGSGLKRDIKFSTYFEYEGVPRAVAEYTVARLVYTPNLSGEGAKQLVYFLVRPSGIKTSWLSWEFVHSQFVKKYVSGPKLGGDFNLPTLPPYLLQHDSKWYWLWRYRLRDSSTEDSLLALPGTISSLIEWGHALASPPQMPFGIARFSNDLLLASPQVLPADHQLPVSYAGLTMHRGNCYDERTLLWVERTWPTTTSAPDLCKTLKAGVSIEPTPQTEDANFYRAMVSEPLTGSFTNPDSSETLVFTRGDDDIGRDYRRSVFAHVIDRSGRLTATSGEFRKSKKRIRLLNASEAVEPLTAATLSAGSVKSIMGIERDHGSLCIHHWYLQDIQDEAGRHSTCFKNLLMDVDGKSQIPAAEWLGRPSILLPARPDSPAQILLSRAVANYADGALSGTTLSFALLVYDRGIWIARGGAHCKSTPLNPERLANLMSGQWFATHFYSNGGENSAADIVLATKDRGNDAVLLQGSFVEGRYMLTAEDNEFECLQARDAHSKTGPALL